MKKPIYILGVLLIAVSSLIFASCSFGNEDTSSQSADNSVKAEEKAPAAPPSDARNTPVVQAAKKVGPAIVGITNKAVARDWFNRQVEIDNGTGSGVIFRSDGYIVTNNHVIDGAKDITVALSDGRTLKASLIGTDPYTDLAVIKVDAENLPTAEFGDSDDIMVGEPAIAIGNPMGLEFQGSVTAGVISALNRTLNIGDNRVKLLQTDAAINPGNSGGALVNADGKVIGINSAKLAATGVEGMGFAIPINTVKPIIDELIANGYVSYPYLGVGVLDKQTAAQAGYRLNVDAGVIVMQIALGGPADEAGIQQRDLILKIDGKETNTVADLRSAISEHNIGDTITITISRNGNIGEVQATLTEMPKNN
ncbi:S1C family serine protease [Megamonas hypermegale]|uniref:S1C family serine protease n=1 Tax=Megamonas hypermegale TaxID=158847 RepID=UPI0025A3DB88|nr:trypsin-like peptidase domain-containing protein [Megamonas hypermegale]MDM8142636.1 trypsin-like peptidase domain-containing protein [Megamonas hypermegale]